MLSEAAPLPLVPRQPRVQGDRASVAHPLGCRTSRPMLQGVRLYAQQAALPAPQPGTIACVRLWVSSRCVTAPLAALVPPLRVTRASLRLTGCAGAATQWYVAGETGVARRNSFGNWVLGWILPLSDTESVNFHCVPNQVPQPISSLPFPICPAASRLKH